MGAIRELRLKLSCRRQNVGRSLASRFCYLVSADCLIGGLAAEARAAYIKPSLCFRRRNASPAR